MIALYTGVSGLSAHQEAVDVIANNIANINTIGYKASRVSFVDALSRTIAGGTASGVNPSQVGLGVAVGAIDPDMSQGSLQATGRPSDLAIQGGGFFVLGSGSEMLYTRAGTFGLDSNNRLVSTANGMAVLGWQADPVTGAIDNTPTITPGASLTIPLGGMALARATSRASYECNLNAASAVGDTIETGFGAYDSLGATHPVTVTFEKTGDNAWTWTANSVDMDPTATPSTGTITFDASGRVLTSTGSCSLVLDSPGGATSPIDFTLDLANVTQLAGESTVRAVNQDGLPVGWLENFSIGADGVIVGAFSNGMTQNLGQVALARSTNPAGMTKVGANLLRPSVASGTISTYAPGVAGTGTIASGYLENSNVNLADEFANLIVTQRGFQANSRIITTADEMLQDLITLKR